MTRKVNQSFYFGQWTMDHEWFRQLVACLIALSGSMNAVRGCELIRRCAMIVSATSSARKSLVGACLEIGSAIVVRRDPNSFAKTNGGISGRTARKCQQMHPRTTLDSGLAILAFSSGRQAPSGECRSGLLEAVSVGALARPRPEKRVAFAAFVIEQVGVDRRVEGGIVELE